METDENKLYTKIILDAYCAVFNSFNIFMNNYLQDSTHVDSPTLYTHFKQCAVESACRIDNFTNEALQIIKDSKQMENKYQYISLETKAHIKMEESEESSVDSFDQEQMLDDIEECEDIDHLNWIDYMVGEGLMSMPHLMEFITPEVHYEIPKYFSKQQSMQIIYITGLILAEVPFILVGPDQSGKTTMLNAAIKILSGLVEKENHIITANIE